MNLRFGFIIVLCFLLIGISAHAIAPESPLEVASSLNPLPVIVIPSQSYHWEAQLIAGKLSERLAHKQDKAVVYFAKNENLFKKVKLQSSDRGKYIMQSRLSYPANISWNPDIEGEGIDVLGGDYALYNDFYIGNYKDGKFTITPVYYVFDLGKKVGKTITVEGEKYLVLDYNSSGKYVKLAKAVEKNLYSISSQPAVKLWAGRGIKIGGYVRPGNKNGSAILMPTLNGNIINDVLISISNTTPRDITEKLKDYFPGYYIYITGAGDGYITLAFAEKSDEITVYNGQSALGYSTTWLPRTVGGHANSIVFAGRAVTLNRYDSARLEATPYSLTLSDYYLSITERGLMGSFANGSVLKFDNYKNYLKGNLNISIEGGGKIKLGYFSNELDNNESTENDFNATACGMDMFLVRNCSAANWGKGEGLKVDTDGDGKLDSTENYVKYNDFFVFEKGYEHIDILPVRLINISRNSLINLNGYNYYILKSRLPDSITLMQAKEVNLYNMPTFNIYYSIKAVEPFRLVLTGLKKSNTTFSFNLFFIKNKSLFNTFILQNISPGDELGDLSRYIGKKVILEKADGNSITLVIQTGNIENIYDDEPWDGYQKVRMGFYSLSKNEVAMFGEDVKVKAGVYEKIKGTPFYIIYRDRKVDIVREKSLVVNSGERLDSSRWPWKDFLKDDLTLFINQEEVYPEVKVRLAGEVIENSNFILLGTADENPLIKKLVEENISKVRWGKSEGNIEVVKNYDNRTVIIISGRDRKAVENAVEGFVNGVVMEYIGIPEEKEEIKSNLSEKTEKNETHIKQNITQSTTVNSSAITEEHPAEKKRGFFSIILRDIARFISGLFGGNR